MRPLMNSEIIAARLAAEATLVQDGATRTPPVLYSRSYAGGYSICWRADGREPEASEVRDSNGRACFSGTRDECAAWLRQRGIDA